MMTRLKINFHKSCVCNLCRDGEEGTRAASILNCNLSSLPFIYLELSVKATALTRDHWQPLIERVEKSLATGKGNALSRGGRLVLFNFVLSSMPLYFMSFYYLREWVIHAIDCFRYAFFLQALGTFTRGST